MPKPEDTGIYTYQANPNFPSADVTYTTNNAWMSRNLLDCIVGLNLMNKTFMSYTQTHNYILYSSLYKGLNNISDNGRTSAQCHGLMALPHLHI